MTALRLSKGVRRIGRCVVALCAAAAAGCGGTADRRPARVPFEARVLLGEVPVEGAVVVLAPADGVGSAASGVSDSTGTVVFSTFGSRDGVLPGRYVVTVSKVTAGSGDPVNADDPRYDPSTAVVALKARNSLPDRYSSSTTSGISVEVSAAVSKPLDLRLAP